MKKTLLILAPLAILVGAVIWFGTQTSPPTPPGIDDTPDAGATMSDLFQVPAGGPEATNPSSNQSSNGQPIPIEIVRAKLPDPRLTAETIFRNIRPEVAYVGDANCAQCHQELCDSYHQHPMGRSAIMAGADELERLDPEAMNPCQVGPFELTVRKVDDGMVHSLQVKTADGTTLPTLEYPVSVAIGSGTRGRSYLTTDGETVWQSPLSWFTTKNRWDVSPGFDLGLATQRPVVDSCLYCHVHQNEVIEDSVNRYTLPISKPQLAIGCERCHGPGELHSKERLEEKALDAAHPGVDTSIVNPKHLPDELQMSICAQCHLGGKARVTRKDRKPHEFRPGLPLDLFFNAFIAHPEAQFKNKAVGHFDQMLQASCRTSAGKRLLCTSCHDPHQKLEHAEADRLQLENCKSCHQERGCSAPVEVRREQQDHCVRCHMPTNPDTDIAHTSLTDHRILRDPTKPTSTSATATNDAVLVPYFQSEGIDSQERERDLGIALARFAEKMPKGLPMKMQTQEQAKKRLRATVQRSPDDWEAWVALSSIEAANGDLRSAWGIIEGAIKASPKNEGVLAQAANIAELGGQMELGVGVMTDLIALNPASQDYRLRRMMMFVSMGEFGEAEVESRELLKINPLQPTARLVLGMCLHGAGKKVEGRREVDYALNIATSENQKASIQAWYNRFVAWRAKSE